MPWVIEKREGKGWCVFKQSADGKATGEPRGCHPTQEEARAQQKALYANVKEGTAEGFVHLTETWSLAEAELADENGVPVIKNVTLIAAGPSKNKAPGGGRRNYTEATLRRDGPSVFEGTPVFVTNHDPKQKTVRELAAIATGVWFDETTKRLRANLHGFASDPVLLTKAWEVAERMGPERVGLSIDTGGRFGTKKKGDLLDVEELFRVPSTATDIVMNPAAGGRLTESTVSDLETREMNSVKERLTQLTEAILRGMDPAAVRYITEGLSEEDIREANPPLAAAILAKVNDTTTVAPPTVSVTAHQQLAPATQTLTEAQVTERLEKMVADRMARLESANLLANTLTEARDLPEDARTMIRERFEGQVFEHGALTKMVADLRNIAGRRNANRVNVPAGAADDRVTEAHDYRKARLEATIMVHSQDHRGHPIWPGRTMEVNGHKVVPYQRISEAVIDFHPELLDVWRGDRMLAATETLRHFTWSGGPARRITEAIGASSGNGFGYHLTEDILTTSFDQAWADNMNRHLQPSVDDPMLQVWRPLVSRVIPFQDLTRTHKFIRVGELGVLPTVAEGGTYQELTAPTDDQQALTIVKKGGLLTLTWEDMLVDDIGVLARIPSNFGRAWAWTMYNTFFGLLQANSGAGQTMDSDSLALYHASHANIASTAFSDAALETVRAKMPVQTDPDSGFRKNYNAKFILFQSPSLDRPMWEVINSLFKIPPTVTNAGEVNIPNYSRGALNLTAIPVIYPTATTTRWELCADPADTDTAVVGFLGGRDTPDIFVQDMETTGSRFTADKITYKARGTFAAAIVNWRAWSRGNS